MASFDEKVELRFLQWQDLYKEEKPFEIVTETIQGSENRRTNLVFGTKAQKKADLSLTAMVFRTDHGRVPLTVTTISGESVRSICLGLNQLSSRK